MYSTRLIVIDYYFLPLDVIHELVERAERGVKLKSGG